VISPPLDVDFNGLPVAVLRVTEAARGRGDEGERLAGLEHTGPVRRDRFAVLRGGSGRSLTGAATAEARRVVVGTPGGSAK